MSRVAAIEENIAANNIGSGGGSTNVSSIKKFTMLLAVVVGGLIIL
jgi:hypothetical protein